MLMNCYSADAALPFREATFDTHIMPDVGTAGIAARVARLRYGIAVEAVHVHNDGPGEFMLGGIGHVPGRVAIVEAYGDEGAELGRFWMVLPHGFTDAGLVVPASASEHTSGLRVERGDVTYTP